MAEWLSSIDWQTLQERIPWRDITAATVVLIFGLVLSRLARAGLKALLDGRLSVAQALLARRFVTTGILGLSIAAALDQLGADLSVLFGAAGIITLALGFASQTSASNLISGIFLIGDNTFSVGDTITVGGTTGQVLSIDLLSVKLRKFDNVLVRIPNETLIKTEVSTLTRFPIRRIQLSLRLPFDEKVERLNEALLAAAERDPLLLEEPAPVIWYSGFGPNGLDLNVYVWARREDFIAVQNNLQANILDEIRARDLRLAIQEHHVVLDHESTRLAVRDIEAEHALGSLSASAEHNPQEVATEAVPSSEDDSADSDESRSNEVERSR